MFSTSMPLVTRPTILPRSFTTGTTARTASFGAPWKISVYDSPSTVARERSPTARRPIRSSCESVYRIPSGPRIAMKSSRVARRIASASSWSSAVGSGEASAASMPGAFARASATASERARASRSVSRRSW